MSDPELLLPLLMQRLVVRGADSRHAAQLLYQLATSYQELGRLSDAEPLFEDALAMQRRLHGDADSHDVAAALHSCKYEEQCRPSEAEPLYVERWAQGPRREETAHKKTYCKRQAVPRRACSTAPDHTGVLGWHKRMPGCLHRALRHPVPLWGPLRARQCIVSITAQQRLDS